MPEAKAWTVNRLFVESSLYGFVMSAASRPERFDLLGMEEEAMSGLSEGAQVVARVVIHRDGQIDPALEVLLDRGDRGGHPVERHVEDVGAATRPEPDAVAGPEFGGTDADALHLSPVVVKVPVHHA
jgi:hypothetical protein